LRAARQFEPLTLMEQPRARSSFVQRSQLLTCGVIRLFGRRSHLFAHQRL